MFESDFEQNLFALRQEKLKEIEKLGQQAYPNQFPAQESIPVVRSDWDDKTAEELEAARPTVTVAGRIMAIRAQGKAGFATLQQASVWADPKKTDLQKIVPGLPRLQIYVRLDAIGEQGFALYKLLDLGDHIGVSGYLFRTRTGELTVHVKTLTFLAKAMLAMPEKFHGLADVELRYRQRYVDLFTNLEAREVFVKRAKTLKALRSFFDNRGYLEVETPMMQQIAGGAAARPFKTHHNALDQDMYLRIAPELYLKRLVVGGLDRVYEINRNFRNEGVSTQHNPEFTMLEFYQAYANYHDLMDLTEELTAFVAKEVNGTTKTVFNDVEIDLAKENWQRLTMRDAIRKWWPEEFGNPPEVGDFQDALQFTQRLSSSLSQPKVMKSEDFMRELKLSTPQQAPIYGNPPNKARMAIEHARVSALGQEEELDKHPEMRRIWHIANQFQRIIDDLRESVVTLGKAVAEVFEFLAEPHLIQPTIIYEFPTAVSPLSKQKPDDPDWVERFEIYVGGFELGNAFSELNDPVEQQKRFEDQLAQRAAGDDEAHQMDEDYVRALQYGLPPTGGMGIGIDRLVMLLTGSRSIRDVILFPLMRNRDQVSGGRDQVSEEPVG